MCETGLKDIGTYFPVHQKKLCPHQMSSALILALSLYITWLFISNSVAHSSIVRTFTTIQEMIACGATSPIDVSCLPKGPLALVSLSITKKKKVICINGFLGHLKVNDKEMSMVNNHFLFSSFFDYQIKCSMYPGKKDQMLHEALFKPLASFTSITESLR